MHPPAPAGLAGGTWQPTLRRLAGDLAASLGGLPSLNRAPIRPEQPRSLADAPLVSRPGQLHGTQPGSLRIDLLGQARLAQALRPDRRPGSGLGGPQRRPVHVPDGPDQRDLPSRPRGAFAVPARRRGAQAPSAPDRPVVPPEGDPGLRRPDRGDHGPRDRRLAGRSALPAAGADAADHDRVDRPHRRRGLYARAGRRDPQAGPGDARDRREPARVDAAVPARDGWALAVRKGDERDSADRPDPARRDRAASQPQGRRARVRRALGARRRQAPRGRNSCPTARSGTRS